MEGCALAMYMYLLVTRCNYYSTQITVQATLQNPKLDYGYRINLTIIANEKHASASSSSYVKSWRGTIQNARLMYY